MKLFFAKIGKDYKPFLLVEMIIFIYFTIFKDKYG